MMRRNKRKQIINKNNIRRISGQEEMKTTFLFWGETMAIKNIEKFPVTPAKVGIFVI